MSNIKVNFSTQSLRLKSIELKQGTFEGDYKKLVLEGRKSLNEGGIFLRNCVFDLGDLKKISEIPNCTDIMFSNVACENISSKVDSSVIAVGVGKNASGKDEFLWQAEKVFISIDVNTHIDYSAISFKGSDNLYVINYPRGINEYPKIDSYTWDADNQNDLPKWIEDSYPKAVTIIRNGKDVDSPNPLTLGVYFDISILEKMKFFSGHWEKAVLFPLVMDVTWELSRNKFKSYPIVTYLLAPLDDCSIVYPKSLPSITKPAFPVSKTSWPDRWKIQ